MARRREAQAKPGGTFARVYNEHATNGLKIYPPTGGDINDGTANAGHCD